jgi:class 3 adenylate cyclase
MVEEDVQRRHAAILAADMVAYSRIMERDEEGTTARQKRHRAELIDPTIAKYHGRIVKTTGDGMLVEFISVVDAVISAIEIQHAMKTREAGSSEAARIQLRSFINGSNSILRARERELEIIFGQILACIARQRAPPPPPA